MFVRVFSLLVIWAGAALAWTTLSETLVIRTGAVEPTGLSEVGQLWGPEQAQSPPTLLLAVGHRDYQAVTPAKTNIAVDLAMDQRKKGLLWYSTYRVGFSGVYRIASAPRARLLHLSIALPADKAMYDGLRVAIGGRTVPSTVASAKLFADIAVPRDQPADVTIAYQSQGLGRWSYQFGDANARVHDFTLVMRTNFRAIDFDPQSLAPTREQQAPNGGTSPGTMATSYRDTASLWYCPNVCNRDPWRSASRCGLPSHCYFTSSSCSSSRRFGALTCIR